MESTYFRRGFGLKAEIEGQLTADYHSAVVEALRAPAVPARRRAADASGWRASSGSATAWTARSTTPTRPGSSSPTAGCISSARSSTTPTSTRSCATWACGSWLRSEDGELRLLRRSTPDDVVILPAFGVTIDDFERLRAHRLRAGGHDLRLGAQRLEAGRELRPGRLHRDHPRQALPRGDQGHREPGHEVSGGPVSRRAQHGRGADRLRLHRARRRRRRARRALREGGVARASTSRATSSGSGSPTRPPCSPASRWPSPRRSGAASSGATAPTRVAEHFRSFDTICSATQERQDAVLALLQEPLDVMVVVGGYNSSNTCHLAALVQSKGVRTFHIEDADGVDPASGDHPPPADRHQDRDHDRRLARRRAGSSASRPARRRRTTRSARRSRGSARWPASTEELRAQTG